MPGLMFFAAAAWWSGLRTAASVWRNLNLVERWQELYESFLFWAVSRWCRLYDLGLVLRYARFSLLMVVIGAVVLFATGQGRELALRLDDRYAHALFFYLGLLLWAFQGWFCARRLLDHRFHRPDPEKRPWLAWSVDHVPRILGLAAFLEAAGSLLLAWAQKGFPVASLHALLLALTLLGGGLFYWFAIRRRDWMRRFCTGFTPDRYGDDLEYIHARLRPFTILYSTVLILLAFVVPAPLGAWLGSLGVLFFAFSSIVPAGSWLILLTERQLDRTGLVRSQPDEAPKTAGFPVITALFLLAYGFSFINDNHGVRVLDEPAPRPGLKAAFAEWERQAAETGGVKPLVIVATAGGGIRAARWTANVLGALTDAEPRFRRALFAISGVSGGSVGAVFYQAALAGGDRLCRSGRRSGQAAGCYRTALQRALSHDFLAPALANMLYPDLIQRFLPPLGLPDRQTALEEGWERAWRSAFARAQGEGLARPLSRMGGKSGTGWLPILLLNGTHMETGRRVVASSVVLDPSQYVDAVDLLSLTGRDLRLSTAAGNSARFAYISPVGTLACKPEGSFLHRLGAYFFCRNGHIADGGYFENYGAVTALETIEALLAQRSLENIQPLVVLISSDPDLACSAKRRQRRGGNCQSLDRDAMPTRLAHKSGGNETFGPVNTMFNTRSARGILAAKRLRLWVETCQRDPSRCGHAKNPRFVHFRMTVPDGRPDPALGWLLSRESEQDIDHMLACSDHNRRAFGELLEALGDTRGGAAGRCPGRGD